MQVLYRTMDGQTFESQEDAERHEQTLHVGAGSPSRREFISRKLRECGITPRLLGYYYLRDAIDFTASNVSVRNNLIKGLYPMVAKVHDTTWSRAERAMRHAIETGSYKNSMTMLELTGDERPTLGAFISAMVDLIREGDIQ